jgi:hypothetical protein
MRKNLNQLLFIIVLFGLFILSSCKEDMTILQEDKTDYPVRISYEEEKITLFDNGKTDAEKDDIDVLMAQPVIKREKVFIGIMKDGQATMEITLMEPKNPFRVPSDALPDPDPQLKTIKFVNGSVYYYDETGKLMSQETSDIPSLKYVIDYLKKNNNSFQRGMLTNVNMAGKSGHTMSGSSVREEGGFIITEDILDAEDGATEPLIGKIVRTYYNSETNELAGQILTDESGELLTRTQYTYSDDINNPIPVFTRNESLEKTKEGKKHVTTTLTYCENTEIMIEL